MRHLYRFSQLLLMLVTCNAVSDFCERSPEGSTAPRTRLTSDRFRIALSGNPVKYVPGEKYTVSLLGSRHHQQPFRFTGFTLVVVPIEWDEDYDTATVGHHGRHRGRGRETGVFSLYGDALTKFSEKCPNTVTQTSTYPKAEIQVLWTAPRQGSGCVAFRATVIEQPNVWYMDDGPLSYTFCEEEQTDHDSQPIVQRDCCACDEAKYELTFEGLWSRHTHPKGFPDDSFLAKFSDVIGASHTSDYYFWNYGDTASKGLKQVAERGSTRLLESELKAKSQEIRTIIKARGISFPNVTGKTFAVFRVDRKHHLMSIVSMIDPSPDWIVGVAGLELCLQNCSWSEYVELNLYPWDVGTDSGITYTSPDMSTIPQEIIRRITSSFPNNDSSPFYDKSGASMKPLARLYLTRQRLYEKSCSEEESTTEEVDNSMDIEDCKMSQWESWQPCSVTCGIGYKLRQRFYIYPERAYLAKCSKLVTSRMQCYGAERKCRKGNDIDPSHCEVNEWSEWTPCRAKCGTAKISRFRTYKYPEARKKCSALPGAFSLQETSDCYSREECTGSQEEEVDSNESQETECEVTSWSEWSPCSATCGKGLRIRSRQRVAFNRDTQMMLNHMNGDDFNDDMPECTHTKLQEEIECDAEIENCDLSPKMAREICQLPRYSGPCRAYFPRWFFDSETGTCQLFQYGGCRGNGNNFKSLEDCEETCKSFKEDETTPDPLAGLQPSSLIQVTDSSYRYGIPSIPSISESLSIVNCSVSEWTNWSECSVTCGRGYKKRTRHVVVEPANGGHPCPNKMIRKRKCHRPPCETAAEDQNPTWGEAHPVETVSDSDCKLSEWSMWSQCSASCGKDVFKQRTRTIIRSRGPGGIHCGPRINKVRCDVPKCKDTVHPGYVIF